MSWNFWFAIIPPPLSTRAQVIWTVLACAAIAGAIILRRAVLSKSRAPFSRTPWRRFARALTATGILLFVFLFFRYERTPFFSSRFWLLLLGIGDAVWIVAIIRHATVQIPKDRAAWEAEQQRKKYLR